MRADPAADLGALLHTYVGQTTLVEFFPINPQETSEMNIATLRN